MKSSLFAIVAILIAILAIAGCVAEEKNSGASADKNQTPETGGQQQEQEQQDQQADLPAAPQCTKNSDCSDGKPCTTDTCSNGVCKHTPEADCEMKVEEKPRILAANFGALDEEFVRISGKNWKINGWKITNSKNETLIQFNPNDYTVINGNIDIYSKCGDLSTTSIKYVCIDAGFFNDTSDKAVLIDNNGTVVSEWAR